MLNDSFGNANGGGPLITSGKPSANASVLEDKTGSQADLTQKSKKHNRQISFALNGQSSDSSQIRHPSFAIAADTNLKSSFADSNFANHKEKVQTKTGQVIQKKGAKNRRGEIVFLNKDPGDEDVEIEVDFSRYNRLQK